MQVPRMFEYERATSVEHALALLARYGPEARVLAGGHSLIPMMKLRLAQPEALIDINDLGRAGPDHGRPTASCASARWSGTPSCWPRPWPGEHFPILHDAERVIADPIVRNRGTIGGSLCQADPSEDLSAVFARAPGHRGDPGPRRHPDGAGARVLPRPVRDRGRARRAAGRDLRVPIAARGGGSAYEKVDRRVGRLGGRGGRAPCSWLDAATWWPRSGSG